MKNRISKEEALKIAAQDAKTIYQDLSVYKITIILKGNNWQIDYDLVNERLRGGGPHYIISKETGEILSKRYEQ